MGAKIIAPDTPTHYHYRGSSVLDLALARNTPYAINAYTLTELSSDHLPVKFLIDTGTPADTRKKFIPNWKKFKNQLLRQAEPPSCTEEINAEVERLTADIIAAYRDSGTWKDLTKSEITEEIKLQTRERNKCKKSDREQSTQPTRINLIEPRNTSGNCTKILTRGKLRTSSLALSRVRIRSGDLLKHARIIK
ncbi:hypothetical protein AVEN_152555-1 [Araneus ventricosus]|uniref:Endonuclease/exonuclease/phosphatase domain-containing protein n=1 Tax=Araneus ventricosus TaxID=182803 RepID=A0A4Y2M8V8_ARAVE|nr:hypothetical protein AVEN_152555-1 [Araneus ventricosus]